MTQKCPCGSEKNFNKCCEPYIQGKSKAPTAEALMRARYSAFATQAVNFIKDSLHPKSRKDYDPDFIKKWSESAQWVGLEIKSTDKGLESDQEGMVEFIAKYKINDTQENHHEIAEFKKENGEWFFLDGKTPSQQPLVRSAPKTGRNDPCPCGSGKKYKKCCAL